MQLLVLQQHAMCTFSLMVYYCNMIECILALLCSRHDTCCADNMWSTLIAAPACRHDTACD